MRIESSPVYVDTSALAKIYVPERESEELESAIERRRDLMVADLGVTELTSALARRCREGDLSPPHLQRVYQRLQRDVEEGEFLRLELTTGTHREAEGILLGIGRHVPLRAADALHLALASLAGARTLLTFDRRMAEAARALGTFELPVPV